MVCGSVAILSNWNHAYARWGAAFPILSPDSIGAVRCGVEPRVPNEALARTARKKEKTAPLNNTIGNRAVIKANE